MQATHYWRYRRISNDAPLPVDDRARHGGDMGDGLPGGLGFLLRQGLGEDEQDEEQVHERAHRGDVEHGSHRGRAVVQHRPACRRWGGEDRVADKVGTKHRADRESQIEDSREATENLRPRTVRGAVGDVSHGRTLQRRPASEEPLDDGRDNEQLVTVRSKDAVRSRDQNEGQIASNSSFSTITSW